MDSETITDYKPKYFVKFNSQSGKVLQVARRDITDTGNEVELVIESDNPVVGEVISGKRSKRSLGALYDVEHNQWNIGEKSNRLVLRELSKRILEIENKPNPGVDIGVKVYKEDKSLEINANYSNIKRNMNLSDISEISKSSDVDLLNLYFTKKGDPDYLIDSIQVDPTILLRNKKLKYRLPDDITKHADLENISIFTRPIFHEYGFQVLDKIVKSDEYLEKKQVLQIAGNEGDCHVIIVKHGSNIKIQSFVSDSSDTINVQDGVRFIVCSNHIDMPVGTFVLDAEDLYTQYQTMFELDFIWPQNPVIVYRSKGLVVNYLGETHG